VSRPRIGAVTIGQAPRPDLLEPLRKRSGGTADVIEAGALDGLERHELPARGPSRGDEGRGAYPLTTRLRDGSSVTLDEAALVPLVQRAIERAEAAGAEATLLLCAGGFLDVTAVARLGAMDARRLIIVVPYPGQAEASRRKWTAAGFEASIRVADPPTVDDDGDVASADAIVLDYVGHPSSVVEALRARAPLPVVDLGEAGADAVLEALAEQRGRATATAR
jgi:protein AroM